MRLSVHLAVVQANVATWRAARERRQRLERDLNCFMTSAERQDLLATLNRYPDPTSLEARELLIARTMRDPFVCGRRCVLVDHPDR